MSWKLPAAAAFVAAGLVAGSSARAGDLFKLALPVNDAPAQTLALKGDAETMTVGYRGHHYSRAYYRPYNRGYAYYRYPYRSYYPRYSFGVGIGYAAPDYYYAPPVYYYSAPNCYYPMSLAVETSSLPGGNVTYSVTRPAAPGAEQVPPPVPRDATFRYDGGPNDPVPMPKADPADPMSAPRHFRIAPLGELKVSLPNDAKESARGKLAYPAYGEESRRTGSAQDRTIVIKDQTKGR